MMLVLAEPSIAPRIAFDVPKLLTMNNGKIPKTISVEKSVKKLTKPSIKTLRIPKEVQGVSFVLSFEAMSYHIFHSINIFFLYYY